MVCSIPRIEAPEGAKPIPDYRRHRVPGGCFFFTVNLLGRRDNDLLTRHVDLLRSAVRTVRQARPFTIDAWVVLPDNLHCVWTLPSGDDDFSTRWRLIKTVFTRSLPADERRSAARRRHQERGIWQRRFCEHGIRDDADFAAHVDYVHFNSRQTRLCRGGRRLAVFHVQGLRSARVLSCRLAWTVGTNPVRQCCRGMTPSGGLRFALNPPYAGYAPSRRRTFPHRPQSDDGVGARRAVQVSVGVEAGALPGWFIPCTRLTASALPLPRSRARKLSLRRGSGPTREC